MITTELEIPSRDEYERMADEYMAGLPLEHYMEGNYNAIQRKITVESFDLISIRRSDVQVCNEMLVQYPRPNRRTGQVVPDNMVVIQERSIGGDMSFNAAVYDLSSIFMVLDYVSKGRQNQRKDYEINRLRYESELRVPYYMLFDPDTKKLTLLHLDGSTYDDVKPNGHGRLPIPVLDLEIAVLDGWVRTGIRASWSLCRRSCNRTWKPSANAPTAKNSVPIGKNSAPIERNIMRSKKSSAPNRKSSAPTSKPRKPACSSRNFGAWASTRIPVHSEAIPLSLSIRGRSGGNASRYF